MTSTSTAEEHVLIVDDNEMVNDVLTFILKEKYNVMSFLNAEDVIEQDVLNSVDVVITDVNLPGMDGIKFLEKIRSVDHNIPVIVITGYNDIDIAISALKSGAFDFILKPFKNEQILLSVAKAIERRRLLVENIQLMEELRLKNNELEQLYKKIHSRNLSIENELDIASNLQKCLFPVVFPRVPGFDFALKFQPVEKISGDFFDFKIFDEKHFSFFFADVSGHGVPAALYSAMVKTAINSLFNLNLSPSQLILEMNNFLINTQSKMSYSYATVFYGYFDLEKGTLKYCNGGIPSPVIIKQNRDMILLQPNGPFIGIFKTSNYSEKEVKLAKGDKLVFYSDGAYEGTNINDVIMGHKKFIDNISRIKDKSINDIIDSLFSQLENYCENNKFIDDITILGMNYNN